MEYSNKNSKYKPAELLKPLFEKAQSTDEFEFCCTLLRIRGLEESGWDPLIESKDLLQEVLMLINAPLQDKVRIRLLLFLYCHATEMDDLYNVIGNLLRVCRGERCSIAPYVGELHHSGRAAINPSAKVTRISEWVNLAGFPKVGEMFEYMLLKQIRNAFYHSDYTIYNDEFRIKHGEGVLIDHVITKIIPLEWLVPRMEIAINIVLTTINLIRDYIQSYKEEKVVPARILDNDGIENVLLTVHPNFGLNGFRSLTEREKKEFDGSGA